MRSATQGDERAAKAPTKPRASERTLLALVGSCIFLAVLNTSMFNVALPAIDREFEVGPARLGWIVTTYSLTFGIATPFYGRLGDLYGIRRFFIVGVVIFTVASLAAVVAPNFWLLLAARTLQATGTASIPSLGMAAIIKGVPIERRGTATGTMAAVVGAGAALGPTLGGLITQVISWRALFLVSALLGLTIPAIRRVLPDERPRGSGALDLVGGLLLGLMVAALLLGVTTIPNQGLLSVQVLGALTIALAATALLTWRIRTAAQPFVDPYLLRNRNYVVLAGIAFLVTMAQFGMLVLIPLLLDRVHHLSSARIGLVLLPPAAAMALLGPVGGRLADRVGGLIPMRIGLALSATGFLLITSFAVGSSPLFLAGLLLLTGAGMGFANSTLTNNVSLVLPPERLGLGIGLFNMVFFLGGAFGAAATTAVLDAREGAPGALNPLYAGPSPEFSDALLVSFLAAAMALVLGWLVSLPRTAARTDQRRLS